MIAAPETRACPFCGTHGRKVGIVPVRQVHHRAHCNGCGAHGPEAESEHDAIVRWNWRRRAKKWWTP